MKKKLIKFWPVIFIFAIWFAFSSPYFIKEKAPFSASYQLNNFAPWSAYPEFAGPVKNGAMPDVITQIYPWKHLVIETWKQGTVPLWNPYSFSGTPLLANYQSAVLSPFNLIFFILPFVDGFSLLVLLQPLLAGFFTYIFVRALKRSETASLISAVSFMFCGFITSWMGYGTLGYAILFLPLSLFSIEKYFLEKKTKFLILLSLTIPLSFFSGHFQISAYFLLATAFYVLYKLVITKDIKAFMKVSIFVAFGMLLSMPQLLPSVEFYSQSFRSNIFQKDEVIPLSYLPSFFAPDFFGNPVTRNDWFGHYAEWNSYIGVLPLIFAFYAVTFKRKSQTLFFYLLGIAAVLFSLDLKFADLLASLRIPVLSTSAASRIIVLYSFMFSVLSAFGFDQLVSDIKKKRLTKVFAFLAVCLGVLVLLWTVLFLKLFIPEGKVLIAERNLRLPSLIFAAGFGLIIPSMLNKKLVYVCGLLMLVLVSFDMLRFATKWQPFEPKNLVFTSVPASTAFSNIAGFHRVIGNFGAESAVFYELPSLEGYDALYIKRYGEFAASITDGELKESYRSVVAFPKDSPNTPAFINLLGVKYIVHKFADGRAGWTFPFWTYPDGQFSQIYNDNSYEIYQNNNAFPHAFLAGSYKVTEDPQEIINILISKKTNLREEIVLENDPGIAQVKGNIGSASVEKYKSDEIEINVQAEKPGMLFLSDNYYKGWTATVDGIETPIYRADYSFRAVPVEKGKHVVKFMYNPFSFALGVWLAVVGICGIVIISLFPRIGVRKT